jgi:hypothetical protein
MPVDVGLINPMGLAAEAANFSKLFPDFAAQELQRRELALRALQEQRLGAENATKAQRLAEYQADVLKLQSEPTDENVARHMMKWPDFANENKIAHDVKGAAKTKRSVERIGAIASAMDANPDLATTLLQESVSSAATAGEKPDPLADQILADWQSGDPTRRKAAKAAIRVKMAEALGPKDYYEATTGKDAGGLEKDVRFLEDRYPDKVAPFLRTKTEGQQIIGYSNGQPVRVSVGSLPEFGGAPAPVAPPPAAPGKVTGVTAAGTPVEQGPKDKATGLVTVTSEKWRPGEFAYLTRSKQEFDKVPSGARFYAPDGKLYVKP